MLITMARGCIKKYWAVKFSGIYSGATTNAGLDLELGIIDIMLVAELICGRYYSLSFTIELYLLVKYGRITTQQKEDFMTNSYGPSIVRDDLFYIWMLETEIVILVLEYLV